ncbi:hypothetical protein SUGI_0873890 [Cryptomeria japonica]|nr:hypothetical protein SUGI_0873890 [Cryptomeria japonica]
MLNKQGVRGPPPLFMLGNLLDMKKINEESVQKFQGNVEINSVRHDIWAVLFPQFKQWSRIYGEKFVFWLGTEPFIYVRDPELIRIMSLSTSLDWGKPTVFREDKVSLFGNGLIMADGTNWAHRRRIVAQAFHMDKIKGTIGDMVDLIVPMVERWRYSVIAEGESADINIEDDITEVTANIIAKTTFGPNYEEGKQVFSNLRNLKKLLSSKCNHLVGVPGSRYMCGVHWTAKKLAKETDRMVESIISSRKRCESTGHFGNDALGVILSEKMRDAGEKKVTTRDLVDDCKAFFIAGHETTTVYVLWSMMLLALNPDWQERVRGEVMEITQGRIPDADMLGRMKNEE